MQTIAIHALTLTIAIVAIVFAVWPAVGDAPWETEVVLTPVTVRQPTRCELLTQQLTNAQTEFAAQAINRAMRGC